MTKTKKARLKAAKKRRLAEARLALDRWREREPTPAAYMAERGLRWYR